MMAQVGWGDVCLLCWEVEFWDMWGGKEKREMLGGGAELWTLGGNCSFVDTSRICPIRVSHLIVRARAVGCLSIGTMLMESDVHGSSWVLSSASFAIADSRN